MAAPFKKAMEEIIAAEEQVKDTIAGTEPVEKTEEEKIELTKSELEQLIQAAEEATALAQKKAEDAENYKSGMLKYKGKLKEVGVADDEEEDQPAISEERIAQIVEARVQAALEQLKPKQEDPGELAKAKLTIDELKLAINNRVGTRPTAAGGNADKGEVKASPADKYFSPEQIAEIKSKFPGLDPNEILKNLPQGGQSGFANGFQKNA